MSKLLLACVLLASLLLAPSAWGQQAALCPGLADRALSTAGGAQFNLTVADTALTLTVPARASVAIIGVRTASIRYTDDGTTPTTTNGIQVDAAQTITVCSGSLGQFRMIRQGAASAIVNILYYQ